MNIIGSDDKPCNICYVCNKHVSNNNTIKIINPFPSTPPILKSSSCSSIENSNLESDLVCHSDPTQKSKRKAFKPRSMKLSKSTSSISISRISQFISDGPVLCYDCYNK